MLLAQFAAVLLGAVLAPQDDLPLRLERLQERLESARIEAHVPGMALAVVKDGRFVLARGFGLADLDSGRPVTASTVFSIGSATKAFTSTLIGMQVEAGTMRWDDPVRTHLPWFHLSAADADEKVTVRDPRFRRPCAHRSGHGHGLLVAGRVGRLAAARSARHGQLRSRWRDLFERRGHDALARVPAGARRVPRPAAPRRRNARGDVEVAHADAAGQFLRARLDAPHLGGPRGSGARRQHRRLRRSAEELANCAGRYLFEGANLLVSVRVDAGRLAVEIQGQGGARLEPPDGNGVWRFPGQAATAVGFSGQEYGPADYLVLYDSGLAIEMPRLDPDPDLPTAAELWELRRAGIGLDRRAAPRSIAMTGTVDFAHQAVGGGTTTLARGLDRFRESIDLGDFGAMAAGRSARGTWSESMFEPSRWLDGGDRDVALVRNPMLLLTDWRESYDQVEVVRSRLLDDRPVFEVNVAQDGREVSTYSVDAESGLVVQEVVSVPVLGVATMNLTFEMSDYREVEGLQMPFRVEMMTVAIGRAEYVIAEIHFDRELAESEFESPLAAAR